MDFVDLIFKDIFIKSRTLKVFTTNLQILTNQFLELNYINIINMDQSVNQTYGILKLTMISNKKAIETAQNMQGCPKLIASGVTENTYWGIYIIDRTQEWWILHPSENPDLLGAEHIESYVLNQPFYPKQIEPKDEFTAPCGSMCANCPNIERFNCPGCPALRK
jgi:hypothetical protein